MPNRTRFLRAVAGACLALAGAAAMAQNAAVHYQRCDSNYDGWGLHLWKSGGGAISGVTWKTPMAPTGKDDFGLYWQMPIADYPDGKLNYIIHKGDTKDQGGRDMQFDAKASPEIWVNDGDAAIHTSLEAAKAARAAKPCR